MAVKVVTDSTSDIPPELAAELGITVVPLTVSPIPTGIALLQSSFGTPTELAAPPSPNVWPGTSALWGRIVMPRPSRTARIS